MLVQHVDDLEATVAQLRARRAEFVTGLVDHPEWGIRTAYLRDPDGTLIELNVPIPREEWSEDPGEEAKKYEG